MGWHYPLLQHVTRMYHKADLNDVFVVACQHLLGTQYQMFRQFLKASLRPENCLIIGKNYSANRRVIGNLKRDGCLVAPFSLEFDHERPFDEWFRERLREFVGNEFALRNLDNYRSIIVLDDGGLLHEVTNELIGRRPNVAGVEQTTSGDRRIRDISLEYPVISVARWWTKLVLESPHIASLGAERILRHLKVRDREQANILVLSLGPIGRNTALKLVCESEHKVTAADTKRYASGAENLLRVQGKLLGREEAYERIGEFDTIIGATGTPVINRDQIVKLHSQVSLISMSSSDREFPAVTFRRNKRGRVHDDYWLGEQCLVNGGFPITFYGNYHEVPPEIIELTIASLQLAVLHSVCPECQDAPYIREQIRQIWSNNQLPLIG